MSRLTDAIKDQVKIRTTTDQKTGYVTTRAEVRLFMESKSMRPVSPDHQMHINNHLAKGLAHHMEELAYGEFSKLLFELHREVRMKVGYSRSIDETILKLKELID